MTCARVREELDLAFGQAELPLEVEQHVHSCVECTQYWKELSGLTESWQHPSLFVTDETNLRRTQQAIAAALESRETPRVFNISFRMQYAIAASVAVIGLALLALLYSGNSTVIDDARMAEIDETVETDQFYAIVGTASLSDDELSSLFEDIDTVSFYSTESSTWESFDDLSQEELDYLKTAITSEDLI